MRNAIAVIAVLLFAGCSTQSEQAAGPALPQLIGMTKKQILSCMGSPINLQEIPNAEIWGYQSHGAASATVAGQTLPNGIGFYNGGSPGNTGTGEFAGTGPAAPFGAAGSGNQSCLVNIVFSSGRVSKVDYNSQGQTGALATRNPQCASVVQGCAAIAPAQAASAPAPAPSASSTGTRADLDRTFVSWCLTVKGTTDSGCRCMPGAMQAEGMSDSQLHDWLVGASAIQGTNSTLAPQHSEAVARAMKRCGLT